MVYCIILHRDGYSGYPSSSSISQRCQHLLVSHSSTPWILLSFHITQHRSCSHSLPFVFSPPVLIIPSCLHFKSFPVSVLLLFIHNYLTGFCAYTLELTTFSVNTQTVMKFFPLQMCHLHSGWHENSKWRLSVLMTTESTNVALTSTSADIGTIKYGT